MNKIDTAGHILYHGLWRTGNIGDVAHAPGMLQLLREHLPGVCVTLMPYEIDAPVEVVLRRDFPDVRIACTDAEKREAYAECDLFLHGSATSFAQPGVVETWLRETNNKPFGVYAVTLAPTGDPAQAIVGNPGLTPSQRDLLNRARFLFLRDTVSLNFALGTGLTCPTIAFAPDSAFGIGTQTDATADALLKSNGLVDGEYLCVIPRLRNTPFWGVENAPTSDFDKGKHAINEASKEGDFAKFNAAIVAFVRETGYRVVLCPECLDHVSLNRTMIWNRLPGDVQAKTVWQNTFWSMETATAVYARALGLLSMDMHSPIMAATQGTPAIVCRWWQQTSKGFMWQTVGLGDWLFDLDAETDGDRITQAVLSLARDPGAARTKVAEAMRFVREKQAQTMAVVAREVALARATRENYF